GADVESELAVEPEGELTVAFFGSRVELDAHLHALPLAAWHERRARWSQSIAPVMAIRRDLHFVPVSGEIPLARSGKAAVAAGRLDPHREASVPGRARARASLRPESGRAV